MNLFFRLPTGAAAVLFTGLLAALIMIGTGCGSPAKHTSPAAGAHVTPDPCKVVTAGVVARIARLTSPVTAIATSLHQGAGKTCEYRAASGRDGAIVAVLRASRAYFEAGRRDAQSRGAQCTDLGIGQASYACGDPRHYVVVTVFVHGLVLSVQATHAGSGQPAQTRALARFAASRF